MPQFKTLANGLRLVTVPCEAESVAVGVFVDTGSRHERPAEAGISHFIEHMLFKGTPTRKPIDISRAIEGRGGNFNACTSEEATMYYAHLPSEYLGEAVDILSDMYLHASIPAQEFAREKQVVIEEIKMYADEPDSVAMENLQRALFPKSALGSPVAGSPESLTPLKPADLKHYIRANYTPQRTIVVVVGAFDPERACDCVRKAFRFPAKGGDSLKCARADHPCAQPPRAKVIEKKDIHQAQLALGYRTFGIDDSRKYAISVMDAILGRGMSSRLFQEVREKRGLSYDISSRMQFFRDCGMFVISAGLETAKAEKALATINRELARIREKRVGAAELKRTKDFLIGNFRLSHEKVVSKLFFYGQTMLSFGRLVSTAEQVEGIAAVNASDIQATAQAILTPANRALSWVLPQGCAIKD